MFLFEKRGIEVVNWGVRVVGKQGKEKEEGRQRIWISRIRMRSRTKSDEATREGGREELIDDSCQRNPMVDMTEDKVSKFPWEDPPGKLPCGPHGGSP